MKELIIKFLKKNWLKVGVATFLLIVAFQDEMSFNINFNRPEKAPVSPKNEQRKVAKQEILSDLPMEQSLKEEQAPNRFNLNPSIFSWKKSSKEVEPVERPRKEKKVQALAKLAAMDQEELAAFVKRFAHVAIGEQEKFGIPASIIIANGLLMSTANQDVLAQEHHNFFQLPCTNDWNGEQTYLFGRCYREYETAWLSFRDHSIYLKQMKIMAGQDLPSDDYKAWARFLGKQNFGGQKDYKRQLNQLIEDMELYYLDQSN